MILLNAIEPVTVHAASMFLIVAAGPQCLVLLLIVPVLYRTNEVENQYRTSSNENVISTDIVTIYVDMTGGNSTIIAKWEVEILQPHKASRQPCQC